MQNNQDEKPIDLGHIDAKEVFINTGQRVIAVTEDKVRLQLIEHQNAIQARDKWIAPLGIAMTLLLALLTTEFRQMVLDAAVWRAIFIISLFLSVGWLIVTIVILVRHRKSGTIEQFINQLKTSE